MDKATLTISLPRTMKDYIAAKLREGRYSTPSEYIRSLIRDDQDLEGRKAGISRFGPSRGASRQRQKDFLGSLRAHGHHASGQTADRLVQGTDLLVSSRPCDHGTAVVVRRVAVSIRICAAR